MKIKLHRVHIQNYRSIRDVDIYLHPYSVFFGMNDSGKSNFLYGLKLAFGNGNIDHTDVFISPEYPYSTDKPVIIDLLFIPVNERQERVKAFDETWALHLGENVTFDQDDNEFFGFRTEFVYDIDREEYIRDKKVINVWNADGIVVGNALRIKTLSAFEFILLDAQRDIALDIRDKASLWNKQISKIKLSNDARTEIENSLSVLSDKILAESPFLQQVSINLSAATNTRNSEVEISPITRNVDELYKGLDIYVTQEASSSFPISYLGLGTRNRAVFSALKTIVNKRLELAQDSPYFCMLAFEEPEAHIHPHSQRQLVQDFLGIEGQRIITTHSPYLLSSSKLSDLIYVALKNAESKCYPISSLDLQNDELRQIERFVLNTRGELLFSNITILAEGETEEQALKIFFKEYFRKEPFELGVSIVGVGGKNYLPFLRVLESIGAEWFIFSDGEPAAIKDLQSNIQKLRKLDDKPNLGEYSNVIILDSSTDFETYLLDNDYDDQIIQAINDFEDNTLAEYELPFFEAFISKHHGDSMSPRNTGKTCEKCGQFIKEKPVRDYLSDGGRRRALCDCMKSGKAKYAAIISTTICKECEGDRRFPPRIIELMIKIKSVLGV